MDPYLERRGLWEDVHTRLIVEIAYALAPQLHPKYRVAVMGELPWVEEIVERYLEIRSAPDNEVITIIELLSHSNKSSQRGREQYERKRMAALASMTHLVEIDILRAGDPMPMRIVGNGHRTDYRIVVSRAYRRPRADIYLFGVRNSIPDFPIPLRPGEVEPILRLNQVLHDMYDRAGYDLAIDYDQQADPPLASEDAQWAAQLLSRRAGGSAG
jgi:hypothetical protein